MQAVKSLATHDPNSPVLKAAAAGLSVFQLGIKKNRAETFKKKYPGMPEIPDLLDEKPMDKLSSKFSRNGIQPAIPQRTDTGTARLSMIKEGIQMDRAHLSRPSTPKLG